jgi:hypothetical protein
LRVEEGRGSGDFDAVAAEKSAFVPLQPGAHPRCQAKSSSPKPSRAPIIFAAIRAKDKLLNGAILPMSPSNSSCGRSQGWTGILGRL